VFNGLELTVDTSKTLCIRDNTLYADEDQVLAITRKSPQKLRIAELLKKLSEQ